MGTMFTMVVGYRGQSYRDMRGDAMADALWLNLQLPAALFYQPDNVPAHHGAVRIGELNAIDIPEEDGAPITAAGVLYDGRPGMERVQPWVQEAMALADGGAIWPSVDPSVMEVMDDGQTASVVMADIPGVTLVSMPAFTGTSITLVGPAEASEETGNTDAGVLYGSDELAALVAAVLGEGHADMPVADRDRAWDGDAAAERVGAECGIFDGEVDDPAPWECYARAFLYRDDAVDALTKGAYKLGFADIIDGELTIIPQGVVAIAAVLQGARGGADIPEADQERLRSVVGALYAHINEATGTDLMPPWEAEAASAEAALVAAAVATVREPLPADAFTEPELDGYQPGYRVEGGRIFGHVTNRAACHRSWAASCVTPPESPSNYAIANRYEVITSEGPLEVGRFTTGLGAVGSGCACHPGASIDDHYCPGDRSAAAAIAHYDRLHTIADVMIGENEAGSVWIAGVMRPGLPDGAPRVLERRVLSGDWRPWGTGSELIEVLALATQEPGFTHRTKHNAAAYTLIASAGPATPASTPAAAADDAAVRQVVREELAREREEASARRSLAATVARSQLAALNRR